MPNPHTPPEKPEGKVNTTDPGVRRMKFGRNFMPAYNAQAVTTEDQIGGSTASNEEAGRPPARSGA